MSRMEKNGKADAMRKRWCAPALPHLPKKSYRRALGWYKIRLIIRFLGQFNWSKITTNFLTEKKEMTKKVTR